jgi:Na+/H+-dicarboxylate symporter
VRRILLVVALVVFSAAAIDQLRDRGWIGASTIVIYALWAVACAFIARAWRRPSS